MASLMPMSFQWRDFECLRGENDFWLLITLLLLRESIDKKRHCCAQVCRAFHPKNQAFMTLSCASKYRAKATSNYVIHARLAILIYRMIGWLRHVDSTKSVPATRNKKARTRRAFWASVRANYLSNSLIVD
jgi:hypothetical protein